jgi:hypothetical protein
VRQKTRRSEKYMHLSIKKCDREYNSPRANDIKEANKQNKALVKVVEWLEIYSELNTSSWRVPPLGRTFYVENKPMFFLSHLYEITCTTNPPKK